MSTAHAAEVKSASRPDETRPFTDKGHMDVVHLTSGDAGRGVFEPGWRWSEHIRPIAGTDSCEVMHVGYVVQGRMAVRMDDGSEMEMRPGDFVHIPPGHDAWVVGEEPCVFIDFGGLHGYAQRR